MKKIILALLSLAITGCAMTLSRTPHLVKQRMIATSSDSWIDTPEGQKIPVRQGDTLLSTQYDEILDGWVGGKKQYTVTYNGQTGTLIHKSATAFRSGQDAILTEYQYSVQMQPLKFTMHSSQDKDAWARANYFVSKNSDMKIQNSSDYLIDTYNPTTYGDRGFTISRLPQGDSVTYDVQRGRADAAFFIRTGKTETDFFIK